MPLVSSSASPLMTSAPLHSSLCSSSPESLSERSSVISLNATLCSSEHRIVCGLSLYPNSQFDHSIELPTLRNLWRLLDCMLGVVFAAMSTFLSVCWACGSCSGRLAAHFSLASVVRRTGTVGTALPREHQRSCRCTGSVATSRCSAHLSRTQLPFIITGISTTSSMNTRGNSTIFWIFWMVGTVSAQRE